MFIVLLGPPGAGKGTQAEIVSDRTGLLHIATGDLFREAVRKGSELGALAKSYMERGELVPDDVTIRMLVERINHPDAEKGVIFDGFPRNVVQAQALDDALFSHGHAIDRAILISVPDEELVARLSGRWVCPNGHIYHALNSPPKRHGICDICGAELYQRDDDKAETVRRRVETQRPPADLVQYYARQGKLDEIDGKRRFEIVTRSLMQALQTVTPSVSHPT